MQYVSTGNQGNESSIILIRPTNLLDNNYYRGFSLGHYYSDSYMYGKYNKSENTFTWYSTYNGFQPYGICQKNAEGYIYYWFTIY